MLKKIYGITIISLVITIIVLLIFSSVTIWNVISFEKAKKSTNEYENAKGDESNEINKIIGKMDDESGDNSISEEKKVLTEEANKPELSSGMTPIKWDGSNWVKASKLNENNDWYDYTKQKWANVAVVSSNYREADNGTVIPDAEIYAMFVWIPRFVYKIPSDYYHKTVTEDSLVSDNNNTNLVDIHFSQTQENGGDAWDANITIANENSTTENASTSWLTSSAFKFGDTELNGFWMAKFKASDNSQTSTENTSKDGILSTMYIKPGRYSEKSMTYDDIFISCRNMETNDIYGWKTADTLNDDGTFQNDNNGLDTHLTKNNEWAAVCFLTNSKYGINKLSVNSNIDTTNDKITGKSTNTTTVYNDNANITTTNNVYGIYDMSSSIWEAVSAYINTSNNIGSTKIVNSQDKYKNVYSAPSGISYTINYSSKDSIYGIFKYINGVAIYESSTSGNASASAWFKGRANIGSYSSNKYQMFFTRGGSYNNIASNYAFGYSYGLDKSEARSFRPSIVVGSGL